MKTKREKDFSLPSIKQHLREGTRCSFPKPGGAWWRGGSPQAMQEQSLDNIHHPPAKGSERGPGVPTTYPHSTLRHLYKWVNIYWALATLRALWTRILPTTLRFGPPLSPFYRGAQWGSERTRLHVSRVICQKVSELGLEPKPDSRRRCSFHSTRGRQAAAQGRLPNTCVTLTLLEHSHVSWHC